MSIPLFDVNSQEPLFDPEQRRTLAEAALRSITASTARARGDDFLRIFCVCVVFFFLCFVFSLFFFFFF